MSNLYRGNSDPNQSPQVIDGVNNVEKVTIVFPQATIDFATGARLAAPYSVSRLRYLLHEGISTPLRHRKHVFTRAFSPLRQVVIRGSFVPVGPQAYALAITAAGARLAPSGTCGEPLAPNAYSVDQTAPAASDTEASSGLTVGGAVAIYVCSVIAVAAAAVFGTYKVIARRAALAGYETFASA